WFFASRGRHTSFSRDWSSDVCSSDLLDAGMDAAILGFEPVNPTGYGRFITDGERLLAIREHKDASEAERKIGLCNACILAFRARSEERRVGKECTSTSGLPRRTSTRT